MRYIVIAFIALFAHPTYADSQAYDQVLALNAGRAYLESYLRFHQLEYIPKLGWDKATTEFVPRKHGRYAGYVGVFVPNDTGAGGGIAVFDLEENVPGYLFIAQWGYAQSLADSRQAFRHDAALGRIPSLFILKSGWGAP
jgi:hypothetical protein